MSTVWRDANCHSLILKNISSTDTPFGMNDNKCSQIQGWQLLKQSALEESARAGIERNTRDLSPKSFFPRRQAVFQILHTTLHPS